MGRFFRTIWSDLRQQPGAINNGESVGVSMAYYRESRADAIVCCKLFDDPLPHFALRTKIVGISENEQTMASSG
jgi:hypothetical protein